MSIASSKRDAAIGAVRQRDFATAVRLARDLTDSGDVYGRIVLARLYMDGSGVPQNLAEAERLLNESESLGSAIASYQKAGLFSLRNDPERMFDALKTAASAGILPAQCALGRCYLWGIGTAPNIPLAESLLIEAAKQGNVRARHVLAYYRAQHPRGVIDFFRQILAMIGFGWYCRFVLRVDANGERLG